LDHRVEKQDHLSMFFKLGHIEYWIIP
jgi:hypothetical protein